MTLSTNEYNYLINQAKVVFFDHNNNTYVLVINNNASNSHSAFYLSNKTLPSSSHIIATFSSWRQERVKRQVYIEQTKEKLMH